MKKNPFLTVMIIPHTGDGPKSLKISVRFLHFISIFLILSMTFSFLWVYDYTYMKDQNESLNYTNLENEKIIEEYYKDYLTLYQDIKIINEKMIELEELENQVRIQNGFDPTKSYFSKSNQNLLVEQDKTKVQASTLNINEAIETVENIKEAIPEKEKSLNELIILMEDRNEVLLSIPSLYPATGRVTSRFGYRSDPITGRKTFHEGYDIANSYGTPIYATADGIVTFSGRNSGYGNEIIINHGNGFETVYAHNSKNIVKKGDFVRKGQVIAYMGSTGRSTGAHLHYEVRKYGTPVNPANYLN